MAVVDLLLKRLYNDRCLGLWAIKTAMLISVSVSQVCENASSFHRLHIDLIHVVERAVLYTSL